MQKTKTVIAELSHTRQAPPPTRNPLLSARRLHIVHLSSSLGRAVNYDTASIPRWMERTSQMTTLWPGQIPSFKRKNLKPPRHYISANQGRGLLSPKPMSNTLFASSRSEGTFALHTQRVVAPTRELYLRLLIDTRAREMGRTKVTTKTRLPCRGCCLRSAKRYASFPRRRALRSDALTYLQGPTPLSCILDESKPTSSQVLTSAYPASYPPVLATT